MVLIAVAGGVKAGVSLGEYLARRGSTSMLAIIVLAVEWSAVLAVLAVPACRPWSRRAAFWYLTTIGIVSSMVDGLPTDGSGLDVFVAMAVPILSIVIGSVPSLATWAYLEYRHAHSGAVHQDSR